jgi:hypothetical protein
MCMEMCARLLQLIGKAEDDPQFQQFLAELKDQYEVKDTTERTKYFFRKLGFSLSYERSRQEIHLIQFHIRSKAVVRGSFLPFESSLPWGVCPDDSQSTIRVKMMVEPNLTAQRDFEGTQVSVDSYHLPHFRLLIMYTTSDSKLILFNVLAPIHTS